MAQAKNIIEIKSLPPKDHNMPITYSETFYSIQGEGYFTGVPSTWVRSVSYTHLRAHET